MNLESQISIAYANCTQNFLIFYLIEREERPRIPRFSRKEPMSDANKQKKKPMFCRERTFQKFRRKVVGKYKTFVCFPVGFELDICRPLKWNLLQQFYRSSFNFAFEWMKFCSCPVTESQIFARTVTVINSKQQSYKFRSKTVVNQVFGEVRKNMWNASD